MAAVRSPLMPSPSSALSSAFSPYTDSPSSPSGAAFSNAKAERSSTDAKGHLIPQPQRSPQLSSPSEAAPSPILSSNGTDFEEPISEQETASVPHETAADRETETTPQPATGESNSEKRGSITVATKDANGDDFRPGSGEDNNPSSVIHAPRGFDHFAQRKSTAIVGRSTPTPSQESDITITSPSQEERTGMISPLSPPPISTAVPPSHDNFTTPRAQTRYEAEADMDKAARAKPSLKDIPEKDYEAEDDQSSNAERTPKDLRSSTSDVAALRTALTECWTLCNTLAGLSHVHRKQAFQQKKYRDGREQAWESCWSLCQKLYVTWDENEPLPVSETLNLCRQFCQSLFEVRQRDDDLADSVLRVSFELNNHLYNTHDRTLPEPYRERTLDFYITLCHRLMKQRNKMAEETDDLLRACWSLAEMLFSLRQNKREGKPANEELLGSAVQSCWELCDLFREGWTQIRPDRGTPRPSNANFALGFHQARQPQAERVRLDDVEYEEEEIGHFNPETPTTIFEDVQQMSPDDSNVPNIVVLGPETSETRYSDWSSSTSSRSGYASSDDKTNSSSRTINPQQSPMARGREDPRLLCLKILVVHAATNMGFNHHGSETLASFVKTMPSNSFGTLPWQMQLLEQYKRLVASDTKFYAAGPPHRASASDIAHSVSWMVGTGQAPWLRDLYRAVFGFRVEEASSRPGLEIEG